MDIKAGKVKGKVVNYGGKETNNGDPAVAIVFQLQVEGSPELTWQGGFKRSDTPDKKGQLDFTLDALEACGLDWSKYRKSSDAISAIGDGPVSGALDMEAEVLLTIEIEQYQGQPRARIKWINSGTQWSGGLSKVDFITKCAGLNLDFEVAQRKTKAGSAPARRPATGGDPRGEIPPSDLPF